MMENYQASGDEIERALMDLGPLLGVSVKEEAPEEPGDPTRPLVTGGADGVEAEARPDEEERCVLCGGGLATGTPRLLECLHSACDQCVRTRLPDALPCPVCRLSTAPANLIDQRFVIEKLQDAGAADRAAERQCSSCGETEPATSYCVDCAEFICDSCVQAHQRLKITKDHTIKSKEEAAGVGGSSTELACPEHPGERLTFFCETCDRLTCRDCQLLLHRDHKYQFSAEMAGAARARVSALLSEVSYKRVLLSSAMKVIRDRQALIADKKKALVREITQAVVRLTDAINTRGKQLVLRLNEVCDGKQRTLAEKKEALEQLAAVTEHCVRFVSGALAGGSDSALLYSKRTLCAQLQRVKSRRADIPNPEIPVRIALALDNLPELLRVLSAVGGIVVDGKVDGGAQGPYHPPPQHHSSALQQLQTMQQQQAHQQQAMQQQALQQQVFQQQAMQQHQQALQHQAMHTSSAVVALQHAAMQQSLAACRARGRTPLRHPHVSSTTHPQLGDLHLRGLLAGRGRGLPYAPPEVRSPPLLAVLGAYGRRPTAPPPAAPAAPAKWHIPQSPAEPPELRRQQPPPAVTSTNPQTPSPAAAPDLDKVCAESVQDLMATIAKLDSNGVQVLPESGSPGVHSSTGEPAAPAAPDPNEDWCAVCMDGGELMCCDKCPKVFHQYCHIPTIDKLPGETETWQCLLCVNFAELPEEEGGGMTARRRRLMERLTLELYCQYEPSLAFREAPAGPHARAVCLDSVRARLQPDSAEPYADIAHFVDDLRQIFRNAYLYNPPESTVYKDAARMEEFLEAQVLKWLPELARDPHKRTRL